MGASAAGARAEIASAPTTATAVGSTTRRGAPTTHHVAMGRHVADGWDGEARRFGEGVAILVGDLAFVYADLLLQGASPAVWGLWHELRIELNIGQVIFVGKADILFKHIKILLMLIPETI